MLCNCFISPMADGLQRAGLQIPTTTTLPPCLWSPRIFPSLPDFCLMNFYRDASSSLLLLYNSRSHAFRCKIQNKNPNFHKNRNNDFRTTSGYTRGYLLDLPCVRYGTYGGIPPVYIAGTTGIGHSSRSGTRSPPISDTSVSSVQRQKYAAGTGIDVHTGTVHFGKFGTTSIPVPDTSVSPVQHQYRYRTLR